MLSSIVVQGNEEERAVSELGKTVAARYHLDGLLGHGETSALYRATDLESRAFAVRLWYAERLDPKEAPRIEARAARLLGWSHPHLVPTLAHGRDAARGVYLVGPFFEAQDLAGLLKKEPALAPEVAVRLILQAASGVAAAQAKGILHGAIKPARLLLTVEPASGEVTVKVRDFGLEGQLGALPYRAPEQAQNSAAADERSDVWSLSAILWEMLSGQRLWGNKSAPHEITEAIRDQPIAELDRVAPWVSRELARVVQRGLERDPALRPTSARALIEDLSVFSGGSDRIQVSELVAITTAQRGALQVRVKISPSAAAGLANLARGGRGGTSLPPKRALVSARSGPGTNSWLTAVLLIVVVGGLSMLLGYVMHRH